MSAPADYNATRDYLYSLKCKGAKYGIDRMRLLVEALGHPERAFPVIHVAGTNGKGSTCSMLEAIYRANGYKTGLYSSPHLVRQGERVQVNREILDEADIVSYTKYLKPIAERIGADDPDDHPSFFEFMTAMAFLRFAEARVDLAFLETGLGGRLDATNIVDPELTIITSISLDHIEQLGDTIEQIAWEKAGIIKPGKPVLIGKLSAAAEAIVRQVAQDKGCAVTSVRERFPDVGTLPETNLAGFCQRWNAATAVAATEIISQRFPIKPALTAAALKTIDWPGRWQTIQLADKTLILDASHNPEGSEMLDENLQKLIEQTQQKPLIVAGTLGEFRARSLMLVVSRHARELHLLAPDQSRATPTDVLATCIPKANTAPVHHQQIEDIFPAVGICTLGKSGDTIVVTGSLYLIGEVLERLTCETPVQQGKLQDTP
jgi:dihydrofolate synthase / folylpolyglutamate synthase